MNLFINKLELETFSIRKAQCAVKSWQNQAII
jgi:hypothetical protein